MFLSSPLPPVRSGYIYDNDKKSMVFGRTMPDVTIYTTQFCPYCVAAKNLLRNKGAKFEEIDVSGDPSRRKTMSERAGGRRTVPQIFLGGAHDGGRGGCFGLDEP